MGAGGSAIDADQITGYLKAKREEGLASKTVQNHLNFLHGIFAFAVKRRWVPMNPVALVDRPRGSQVRNRRLQFLQPEELEAVIRATPDDKLGVVERPLYLCAAMTGMRQGELLALCWADVDWTARRVRVVDNFTRGRFGTPKSDRGRSVPMADRLAAELERHFQRSHFQADDDLVFSHPETGNVLDPSKLRKRFGTTVNRAGVEEITFHKLRLLGLLREEEGLAARVLQSLDITVEGVEDQVVRIVGSGEEVTSGQIPFTPRAKKVLELALSEALSLDHNYIGTEHILLGLVRENEGVAARILLDFDADSEKIRNEVIRMLSVPGGLQRTVEEASEFHSIEPWRETVRLPAMLLDGAGPLLWVLLQETEQWLGRSADAGDLLVMLASVPEGLAAQALARLGVDGEQLARVVEESRAAGARSALLPPAALIADADEAREQKKAAIKALDFDRAAPLRERELDLRRKAGEAVDERRWEEMLATARALLRLGEQ